MPVLVVDGAVLTCSFGLGPSPLVVIPTSAVPVQAEGRLVARIDAIVPTINIQSFGMCSSLANPVVAAATAAAQGVLTPQPCIPATAAPWTPGSQKMTVGGVPALTNDSQCTCLFGGVITVGYPGQTKVTD